MQREIKYKMLTNEELVVKAQNGDELAWETLYIQNKKIILYMLKEMNISITHEDAIGEGEWFGVGEMGFIRGVNKYEHSRGRKFTTFVCSCIRTQILMHLRDNYGGTIKSTERMKSTHISMDGAISCGDGKFVFVKDAIPDKNVEKMFDYISLRIGLDKLKSINKGQYNVIKMRYIDDLTQKQVCERLGTKQSSVSKLEKRALKKLRELMREDL